MPTSTFKKTGLAIATATFALCSQVKADTIGIYAGIGAWQSSISGDLKNQETVSIDELNLDDPLNTTAFLALEHPIPVIPNIKITVTDISSEGTSTITRDINLIDGQFAIPVDAATESSLDLSHIDYTLYYEVLDNYVSWDIGLTGRSFSGEATLSYTAGEDPDIETDTEQVDLNGIIPMAYSKLQLDLPFTGWYLGGSANFISFENNTITDAEAKLGYMTSGLGLEMGFDLGYRSFSIVAEPNDDELHADLTLAGPYASLLVHF